jgi:hypothetical protein
MDQLVYQPFLEAAADQFGRPLDRLAQFGGAHRAHQYEVSADVFR